MFVSLEDRAAAAKLLNAHGVDIDKPNTNRCVCGVNAWRFALPDESLEVSE